MARVREVAAACVILALALVAQRARRRRVGMRRLRVVHYNVKRFGEYEAVAKTLEGLKPDIVTLNEVDLSQLPSGSLEPLAARLGLGSAHFFGHVGGAYGNAVLCDGGRVVEQVRLDGGSLVQHRGREHRIVRGLLVVADLLGTGLAVAATHLDHIAEAERATQARTVVDVLAKYDQVLLAGDLNALRRDDYGHDQWAALSARNARNGWTPPANSAAPDGALDILHRARFVDLARLANATPHFTSLSHCLGPCQRIDYLLARGTSRLAAATLAVDHRANGSDHFPLVADLLFRV
mmetsp:Transcript_18285/g.57515  ORF Transcript_18285/g.57515 Transcript_18285/m.57515 type:complete len:294 (+) Transcript_18285:135-1016(+)